MGLRKILFVVLAVAAVTACQMGGGMYGGSYGGGGGGGTVKGPGYKGSNMAGIAVSGFAFSPSSVTFQAKSGVTVTWMNYDGVTHNATADGGLFGGTGTGDMAPNGSYSFMVPTGTAPGSYTYHCRIHTYMTGVINVQ